MESCSPLAATVFVAIQMTALSCKHSRRGNTLCLPHIHLCNRVRKNRLVWEQNLQSLLSCSFQSHAWITSHPDEHELCSKLPNQKHLGLFLGVTIKLHNQVQAAAPFSVRATAVGFLHKNSSSRKEI